MLLPIALTLAYLAVNLALTVWLERERDAGRRPAARLALFSTVLRYGPPLAGAIYLVAIAGDWPFILFVLAFFAGAFWLMDGLLAYSPAGAEALRKRREEDGLAEGEHEPS